jgi:hypothetical protein
MRDMSSVFSEDGKRALNTIKDIVQSPEGADEMVGKCALELALKGDAEAEAELQKGSRELVEQIKRRQPALPDHVVNGLVIGFCELIAARFLHLARLSINIAERLAPWLFD